jgi:hypothetical protein
MGIFGAYVNLSTEPSDETGLVVSTFGAHSGVILRPSRVCAGLDDRLGPQA